MPARSAILQERNVGGAWSPTTAKQQTTRSPFSVRSTLGGRIGGVWIYAERGLGRPVSRPLARPVLPLLVAWGLQLSEADEGTPAAGVNPNELAKLAHAAHARGFIELGMGGGLVR